MANAIVQAEHRRELGSAPARRLRREGKLPAILYGHGMESVPLSLPRQQVEHSLHRGSHTITLALEGDEVTAVVRDVQYDTMTQELLHVDLVRIVQGERVHVSVPITLMGEASGITKGGILDQVIHELELECLPDRIPDRIVVDVGSLEIGNTVLVRELELAEGVDIRHKADSVVVTVHPPRVLEEVVAEEVLEEEEAAAAEAEEPRDEAAE